MDIGIGANMYRKSFWELGENPYKSLKEFGFSYIDFGMGDTEQEIYTLPLNETEKILLEQKRLMNEAGVKIGQVHGPWVWPPKESFVEGGLENRMIDMKRGVENAAILGCKYFVIHPVMPYFINDIGTENEPKTWEANVKFMKELTAFAKERDVVVCIENMPMVNFSIATPTDILRLVEEINDDNFKICLDTGHVAIYGNMDIKKEVLRIGEHLRVLHVHDNCEGPDIHLFPYNGDICWSDFADALREIKYEGVFNLEVRPEDACPLDIRKDLYKILARIANSIINS